MHVADVQLEPEPLDAGQVVEGSPATAARVLWASADGRIERGVWEITPGVVTDVEADELFVVLSGRATIEVQDGPTLEVGPGDAGGFCAPATARSGACTRRCARCSRSRTRRSRNRRISAAEGAR